MLQVGNWQRAAAHFKGRPTAPKPLTRPGDARTRVGTGTYTPDQMQQILDTWSEHEGTEFRSEEMG